MPAAISVERRIDDDRREIARLRDDLAGWLGVRRKRDTLQQFKTQLKALEDVLLKALAGIESELAVAARTDGLAAVDVCRRVERATVWARRIWSFFKWRFDQRDDPRFGRVLAAADEIVWSCYVEPFRAANLDTPSAPLPYLDDRFSPYAVSRIDPPPDLRFDVEAALIREFLSTLPIPVLGLPPVCAEYPWWLSLVAHEVGHHVQYDLLPGAALVEQFKAWLGAAIGDGSGADVASRWKSWGREIFADAWSVVMIGPAALWALVDLEVGAEDRLLRSHPAYPSPLVRFALMAALLRELDIAPADALRGVDPAAARLGPAVTIDGKDWRARFNEDADVAGSVATALAGTAVAHGLTLGDLGRWQSGNFAAFGTTSKWTTAFEGADPPTPVETVESARLAMSGAVWAWSNLARLPDAGREDSRKMLRDRVISTIAASREQSVRAAVPQVGFAAGEAGDRLCALVLDAPEPGPDEP